MVTHASSLSLSLSLSALSESVKACGAEALALLGQMKQQDSMAAADNSKLKAVLEAILATAEVCTPLKTDTKWITQSWCLMCLFFSPRI